MTNDEWRGGEKDGGAMEQGLHQMRDETLALRNTIDGLLQEIKKKAQSLADSVHYVGTADGALERLETVLVKMER